MTALGVTPTAHAQDDSGAPAAAAPTEGEPAAEPGLEAPTVSAATVGAEIAPNGATTDSAAANIASADGGDARAKLDQMGAILRDFGEGDRSYRIWGSLMFIGMGAALLPVGIVMLSNAGGDFDSDEGFERNLGGVLALAGGIGMTLGGLLNLIVTQPMEGLLSTYEERIKAGAPAEQTLAQLEAAWFEAAENERTIREVSAYIGIIGGILSAGAGAVVGLTADEGSPSSQYLLAGALVYIGSMITIVGARQLWADRSPVEASYRAYQRLRSSAPQLGFAPTKNGGLVTYGVSF
ncbi:MAG: hypothetical protein R3A78_08905 [Polyangiales bacterium]